MINHKKLLIVFILLLFNQHAFALSPNTTEIFLEAKQLLKEGSITSDTILIYKAKEIFLGVYIKDSTFQNLFYLLQSEYELLRIAFAFKNDEKFYKYYDSAVKITERLIKEKPDWSEPYALLSLLYGYKMAKNNFTAFTLGPKAYFLVKRALELDAENPRAWFVWGTVNFHMPKIFGGGIDKAIPAFKKSLELYNKLEKNEPLTVDWGKLDAILWLGWAYEKEKQPDEAFKIYRSALNLYPQAKWINSAFLEPLQKRYNLSE